MSCRFIHDLIREIVRWWRHDRIRVSPRERLILRLQPGDLILIGRRCVQIESRGVFEQCGQSTLCLTCLVEEGPAELRIAVTDAGQIVRIDWIQGDRQIELYEDELEAWPRSVGRPVQS